MAGIPFLLLGCLALVGGCSEGSGSCDCPLGEVCIDGKCYPQPCDTSNDCPVGFDCIDSFCREQQPCQTDADCDGGRCVEGHCYPIECTEGETRPCQTDCGTGTEYCTNGVWRGCDAPKPQDEICGDNIDNDCDGETDERCSGCIEHEQRGCETACGTGTEWCIDDAFMGCTAPQPFDEICGDGRDNDCDGDTDEECTGCEEEATRDCQTVCGSGTERCRDNAWTGCDAPRPHQEVCDGEDNDCDGDTDENLVRDCSTECGPGQQICTAGQWGNCSAIESCSCDDDQTDTQICGDCGTRERVCSEGSWDAWGACEETGDCVPGEEETRRCDFCGTDRRVCTAACVFGPWDGCAGQGVCQPDQVADEECGTCGGTRSRTCTEECIWDEWSECEVPPGAECQPGRLEERDCERCGTESRLCGDDCTWGDWGACENTGDCEPDEEEGDAQGCPDGYVRTRVCDQDCAWGDWGDCELGGQCVPEETEDEVCGNCGTRTRVCDQDGVWSDWGVCQDEGPCEPDETGTQACGACLAADNCDVGICQAGTQSRTCGQDCQWGGWSDCDGNVDPGYDYCGDGIDQDCSGTDADDPDDYEPNDTCASAYYLGEEPDMVVVYPTIDVRSDHDDYFYFDALDGADPTEHIEVWVEYIPDGVDVDVCLYRYYDNCVAGNDPIKCSNNWDQEDEYLSWGEGFMVGDDGEYFIRVFRIYGNSCGESYRLTVHGLR